MNELERIILITTIMLGIICVLHRLGFFNI